MPMPPYPVLCYAAGCESPALYKIAAKWSDGTTNELKTYSLACATCLPQLFALAAKKRAACRLAVGESLDAPGIYELNAGGRDRALTRRSDLESVLHNQP